MNSHQRRMARRAAIENARMDALVDCGVAFKREYGTRPVTREDFRKGAMLMLRNPHETPRDEFLAVYGFTVSDTPHPGIVS